MVCSKKVCNVAYLGVKMVESDGSARRTFLLLMRIHKRQDWLNLCQTLLPTPGIPVTENHTVIILLPLSIFIRVCVSGCYGPR